MRCFDFCCRATAVPVVMLVGSREDAVVRTDNGAGPRYGSGAVMGYCGRLPVAEKVDVF